MRQLFILAGLLAAATGVLHAQSAPGGSGTNGSPPASANGAAGRGPTGQLIYPAKGQSAQQAERDKFECHEWAREQSGFDPVAMPPQPAAQPQARPGNPAGSVAAGAAGALGGAAIAEIADKDAGKGAAVGLLGAGLRQQLQQQKQLTAQQQQALQQQAAVAHKRDVYGRGFAACMEARAYVVK